MHGTIWNKFHTRIFIRPHASTGMNNKVSSMLDREPELAQLKDKKGVSALFQQVANGHHKIVDALLHITKKPDDIEPEKLFTPLLIAATNGHIDVVRVLLIHGANPNIQNVDGVTPLHNSIFEGHVETVKLLLEYGANPAVYDRLGNTPIDLAKRSANSQLRGLLK